MSAIQRLEQWIEILEAEPAEAPLNLCVTEVEHLLFDLRVALREIKTAPAKKCDKTQHITCAPVCSRRCASFS